MSPLITGVIIFAAVQGLVATNLIFTLRGERKANGQIAPQKMLVALLPMIVVDIIFILWLMRQLHMF
jgi:heme/copper-type cytochrome/quinol oxidase subunit 4